MGILRDVWVPDLRIVFCGTAVGSESARRGAYYAGPGNAFWRTLFEVGLTPRQLQPKEFEAITEYGLGLTDLAKNISGSDDVLSDEHFDRARLRDKIYCLHPRVVAFTSKRAAEEYFREPVSYGLLEQTIGATALFVLPSPSGAARRFWSTRPWQDLTDMVRT